MDCPDFEASRARGFVLRSLELQHPQLHIGNPISKSYRLTSPTITAHQCINTIATWDNLVEKFVQNFYYLFDHIKEEEADDDDDPDEIDNVLEIFKIDDDLFNFDTPLCIEFEEFNYLLKIKPDLFTYDVQEFKTYDEYEQELKNHETQDLNERWSDNGVPYQLCDHICEPCRFKNGITKWPTCSSNIDGYCNGGELPGMVRVGRMTYFQDHKWYDNLIDGCLKDETLMHKAQIEGSWGDATPGVMKFCTWLINSFENFHELDYDVLVKLEECWHMENPTHEPSTCKIKRFEMMKYLFEADEEYVAIKELEHINHSKTNMDARYAYRELFRKMDDGWLMTRAMDE
ncbi:hypothetical protein Tco_0977073 [Tanacetum coccineum]|uniref:Uncharacterized protein n=1 Tax=Tanacetum coccineum TaxID=301880 RepID=A0ABQ5EJ07_9ASTR